MEVNVFILVKKPQSSIRVDSKGIDIVQEGDYWVLRDYEKMVGDVSFTEEADTIASPIFIAKKERLTKV